MRLVTFYDVFLKTPLDLSGWRMLAGLIVASISKKSVFRNKNINVKDDKLVKGCAYCDQPCDKSDGIISYIMVTLF